MRNLKQTQSVNQRDQSCFIRRKLTPLGEITFEDPDFCGFQYNPVKTCACDKRQVMGSRDQELKPLIGDYKT